MGATVNRTLRLALLALAGACVPEDTSVAKGGIAVHFGPGGAVRLGSFTTDDGWQIDLERVIVFANASTSGRQGFNCYGSAELQPLVDLRVGGVSAGVRALEAGPCEVSASFASVSVSPTSDSNEVFYGPGTTKGDLERFLLDVTGPIREFGTYANVAIIGSARHAARAKRIELVLRAPPYSASPGGLSNSNTALSGVAVQIPSGGHVDVTFVFEIEQIFRTSTRPGEGRVLFEPWAKADDLNASINAGSRAGVVTGEDLALMDVRTLGNEYSSRDFGFAPFLDGGSPSLDASSGPATGQLGTGSRLAQIATLQLQRTWRFVP